MTDQVLVGSLIPVAEAAQSTVVHTPAGQTESKTLRLTAAASHLTIIVEDTAQAEIVVWIEGDVHSHAAEAIVGNEARCTVLTMNAATGERIDIVQKGKAGTGSVIRWQNVTIGSAVITHDLVSTLEGADSESAVDWMFYAKGTERQKLTVRNVFNGRNGRGEILMRGIAEQKGHTECRGLIDIGLQGGGTNTYLTQEVLMLDPTSKVDAIPALEIKTNDVKASHSATIARVTEEDLFYFGARGIAPVEARRMFVLGFLGDITQRVTSDAQRELIISAIEAKYQR